MKWFASSSCKRAFVLAGALVVAVAVAGPVGASNLVSTWAPAANSRNSTANYVSGNYSGSSPGYGCTSQSGYTCILGGVFFDGPPTFAIGVQAAAAGDCTGVSPYVAPCHYWYAAAASDRGAIETQPLVPYSTSCSGGANQLFKVNLYTGTTPPFSAQVTSTTASNQITAASETDITRNVGSFAVTGSSPSSTSPDSVLSIDVAGGGFPGSGNAVGVGPQDVIHVTGVFVGDHTGSGPGQVNFPGTFSLNGAIGTGDTSFNVTESVAPSPTSNFYIHVDDEVMQVATRTLVSGSTYTYSGVTRAVNWAGAATHTSGAGGIQVGLSTVYNNAGTNTFPVETVDSLITFEPHTGNTSEPPAVGDTGAATIYRATFTVTGGTPLTYSPADAAVVTGVSAAYNSPGGSVPYAAWYVETVPSSTQFTVNIQGSASPFSGTGTWAENNATFQTDGTAHGLVAGSLANISGFSGSFQKYNGTWTVKNPVTATTFHADIDSAPSSTTGGQVAKTPFCEDVYFTRSWDNGTNPHTTWTAPVAMDTASGTGLDNQGGTTHVERYSIAAAGSNVYMIYATTVGYYNQMCSSNARVLYFRRSTDYGKTWGSSQRITSLTDRIDYPAIAAYGTNVVIAGAITAGSPGNSPEDVSSGMTNPPTGVTKVALWLSTDSGASFLAAPQNVTPQSGGKTSSTYDNATSPAAGCTVLGGKATVEGWYPGVAVAVNDTHIGEIFWKDNLGFIRARVGTISAGVITWGGACGAGGSPSDCAQSLVAEGVGGGKGPVANNTRGCPSYVAANGYSSGACGGATPAVAVDGCSTCGAGSTDNTRFAFAWTNDECNTVGGYVEYTGCPSYVLPGLWAKVWTFSGGWGAPALVTCVQSSFGCTGSAGAARNSEASEPSIAFYGTTGVGVTYSTCRNFAGITGPCDGGSKDPGDEIDYKESGDNGAHWGGDWGNTGQSAPQSCVTTYGGPANCAFLLVANDSQIQSQWNYYPALAFDKPTSTTPGCAQQAGSISTTLAPEVGCKRVVYYQGINTAYTWYRSYIVTGTEN